MSNRVASALDMKPNDEYHSKIVKTFFTTVACFMCFMNTNVAAIDLPSSAKLVASDQSDTKNISLALSSWDREEAFQA